MAKVQCVTDLEISLLKQKWGLHLQNSITSEPLSESARMGAQNEASDGINRKPKDRNDWWENYEDMTGTCALSKNLHNFGTA